MGSPVSLRALGECNAIKGEGFGDGELTSPSNLEAVVGDKTTHIGAAASVPNRRKTKGGMGSLGCCSATVRQPSKEPLVSVGEDIFQIILCSQSGSAC